jgi:hypothetical protein
MEIFAFTKANIDFIHHSTLESCLLLIDQCPYWIVLDRTCYHLHKTPEYIIYRNRPIPFQYAYLFDSYFHVIHVEKPLYSISTYLHADLCLIVNALQLPVGTKPFMYASIKAEIGAHEEVVKKLIRHSSTLQ